MGDTFFQDQDEKLISLLAARTYFYRVLQLVTGNPPTQEALGLLVSDESKEIISAYASDDTPTLKNAVEALNAIADHLKDQDFISTWNQEYTDRFLGPCKLEAPPWESVYVSKEALLFQKSTLEVRQFYRKYNVLPKEYPHVADDHLGLELDFMSLLSQKAYDAFEGGLINEAAEILKDQQRFLSEHLLKWIPEYAKKSGTVPDSGLYTVIANVIKEFSEKDYQVINELLEAIEA